MDESLATVVVVQVRWIESDAQWFTEIGERIRGRTVP